MPSSTRILDRRPPSRLGSADAALSFVHGDKPPARGRGLQLDGVDAFTLSFWCGTCPLVFERLAGSNRTLSSDALQGRLNAGLTSIDDDLLRTASLLVPEGDYLPTLLAIEPRLVNPAGPGDYFAEEQVAHQGIDSFWGLPENPHTPYYRAGESQIDDHNALYEFVVPMVPPTWNDQQKVDMYVAEISSGASPTALVLSIVDRTQPFDSADAHTGLVHFILDGHHKFEAAARAGGRLTVLSLLALDEGLSFSDDAVAVLDHLAGD